MATNAGVQKRKGARPLPLKKLLAQSRCVTLEWEEGIVAIDKAIVCAISPVFKSKISDECRSAKIVLNNEKETVIDDFSHWLEAGHLPYSIKTFVFTGEESIKTYQQRLLDLYLFAEKWDISEFKDVVLTQLTKACGYSRLKLQLPEKIYTGVTPNPVLREWIVAMWANRHSDISCLRLHDYEKSSTACPRFWYDLLKACIATQKPVDPSRDICHYHEHDEADECPYEDKKE